MVVCLRVQPGARRDAVVGTVTEADGSCRIKIALTAPPEGGKANAALVALLARRWKVPKSAIVITQGTSNRRKTILVAGDPATILARIHETEGE